MPKYTVVSRQSHAGRRWQRAAAFRFASGDAMIPLVMQELPGAAKELPLGFVKAGDIFVPVALQGLEVGQNLFVGLDGQWLASHTPLVYRTYPFQLLKIDTGQTVLCVDEESELVTDGLAGEYFFNEDGTPSAAIQGVFEFLSKVQSNREATERVCAALQAHNLIQAWPISVKQADAKRKLDGIFRIDEAAFNALPGDALLALRDAGALPVVYCQLLSMQNLSNLALLARSRPSSSMESDPDPKVKLDFFDEGGTINFGKIF